MSNKRCTCAFVGLDNHRRSECLLFGSKGKSEKKEARNDEKAKVPIVVEESKTLASGTPNQPVQCADQGAILGSAVSPTAQTPEAAPNPATVCSSNATTILHNASAKSASPMEPKEPSVTSPNSNTAQQMHHHPFRVTHADSREVCSPEVGMEGQGGCLRMTRVHFSPLRVPRHNAARVSRHGAHECTASGSGTAPTAGGTRLPLSTVAEGRVANQHHTVTLTDLMEGMDLSTEQAGEDSGEEAAVTGIMMPPAPPVTVAVAARANLVAIAAVTGTTTGAIAGAGVGVGLQHADQLQ